MAFTNHYLKFNKNDIVYSIRLYDSIDDIKNISADAYNVSNITSTTQFTQFDTPTYITTVLKCSFNGNTYYCRLVDVNSGSVEASILNFYEIQTPPKDWSAATVTSLPSPNGTTIIDLTTPNCGFWID